MMLLSPNNLKAIYLYDISSGKIVSKEITHSMDICEIQLNQTEQSRDRKIFSQIKKDLYISNKFISKIVKIKNKCDSFAWNDSNDMLCPIEDEKFNQEKDNYNETES